MCALLAAGCALSRRPSVTPTNTRVARQTALAVPSPALPPAPAPTHTLWPAPGAGATATARAVAATPVVGPAALPTPTPALSIAVSPLATPAVLPLPPLTLRQWPALSLRDWPRPARDNGLGIHFLPSQYFDDRELDYGIARMQEMGLRWALVLYGDEKQLERSARKFKDAGIMVVWRKMLRAYEPYYGWERDINLLRSLGVEPYMQVYNEPELAEEWDGRPIDRALALENVVQASRDIYNAGGYVGLQFIQLDWLHDALQAIKARQGDAIFGRTFFIPHPYGLNHPPDYEQDLSSVLSFLRFADVFQEEIGFTPPMIAGEGGWKYKAGDDSRYPPIDEARHRDYHVAVFQWFRTGKLSNGMNLPDYLLAFCPWLLFGGDSAAWVDGIDGTRTMTVGAVKAMSAFTRRFSWEPR